MSGRTLLAANAVVLVVAALAAGGTLSHRSRSTGPLTIVLASGLGSFDADEPSTRPAPEPQPATPPPTAAAAAAPAPGALSTDSCPPEMQLVEGNHCYFWEQPCARWDDPDGQPSKRVCGEFQKPSTCKTGRHPMRFCIDRDEYIAPGESVPAKAVSYGQADMICASMSKRLCTSLEWEFACEGEEGLPYPYGYERAPALCNQDRLLRDGKNKASGDFREPPHATCSSPFGVHDMVGNVDEWVRQPWAKAPRRSELRGGWWMTGRNRCRANTSHHDEKYAGPQTGFRCCREAPVRTARRVAGSQETLAQAPTDP
jgi:sulfatase modifying factor 1